MNLNPRQPLWLPAGSVRAIMALALVAAVVAVDPSKAADMAAVVVAFYFASKVATNK
jgi:hypothetical protein